MGGLWHANVGVGMVRGKVEEGSATRSRADSTRPGFKVTRLEELGIADAGQEFVGRVCASLRRQGMTLDRAEMMAFGLAGLVEAAERFDDTQGVEFRSFAFYRVRGAIIDGMRKMGSLSRRGYHLARALTAVSEATAEVGEESGAGAKDPYLALREKLSSAVSAMTVSLYSTGTVPDDVLGSNENLSVEERLRDLQLGKLVKELLLELPEPERSVLRRHYVEEASFEQIATELEVSRSWVCRIHGRGVRRLGLRVRASL